MERKVGEWLASSEPECEHDYRMKIFYQECEKCGWLKPTV